MGRDTRHRDHHKGQWWAGHGKIRSHAPTRASAGARAPERHAGGGPRTGTAGAGACARVARGLLRVRARTPTRAQQLRCAGGGHTRATATANAGVEEVMVTTTR